MRVPDVALNDDGDSPRDRDGGRPVPESTQPVRQFAQNADPIVVTVLEDRCLVILQDQDRGWEAENRRRKEADDRRRTLWEWMVPASLALASLAPLVTADFSDTMLLTAKEWEYSFLSVGVLASGLTAYLLGRALIAVLEIAGLRRRVLDDEPPPLTPRELLRRLEEDTRPAVTSPRDWQSSGDRQVTRLVRDVDGR